MVFYKGITMSKILLIGNGPSAIEKELGSRIDSNEFDKVVRFNRWKFKEDGSEYKNNHSKFVGTRCDYWIINDLHLTETKLGVLKKDLYELVLVVMPKFKFFNQTKVNEIESQYPNIKFIPTEYEDSINNISNFLPKWPSTGIMGIHFAINHFDKVYLHGFDFYDCKYDNLHYFEDKNAPHGLNKFKFNNSKDHTPQTEKTYIKHITEKYNIKFL